MDDHEHTWVTNGCGGFCTGMRDERRHCMEKLERDECNRRLQSHDRLIEALENALNGMDAAYTDVQAEYARFPGPSLEAAKYNLRHAIAGTTIALAAARGEAE